MPLRNVGRWTRYVRRSVLEYAPRRIERDVSSVMKGWIGNAFGEKGSTVQSKKPIGGKSLRKSEGRRKFSIGTKIIAITAIKEVGLNRDLSARDYRKLSDLLQSWLSTMIHFGQLYKGGVAKYGEFKSESDEEKNWPIKYLKYIYSEKRRADLLKEEALQIVKDEKRLKRLFKLVENLQMIIADKIALEAEGLK